VPCLTRCAALLGESIVSIRGLMMQAVVSPIVAGPLGSLPWSALARREYAKIFIKPQESV
jgi:hypothetical protein